MFDRGIAMDLMEKLTILTDAAKYDAACTSSGVDRGGKKGMTGNTSAAGICHAFAADGRCISLLKVLMTNACIYDCRYCVNRRSNDSRRAAFAPRELADLTMAFYRRNYIEGLFLSSGIMKNPDYTCEQMIEALRVLREEYRFNGYIHAKAIPGADPRLIEQLGLLADRLSVNIELPSEQSLGLLAPDKSKKAILRPMGFIQKRREEQKDALVRYQHAPRFAPAGQSTQMMIGATPESDYQILRLTEGLYQTYRLKRVFYSAYVPAVEHSLLPARDVKPPLLREHRLYQADWLLRFYGFEASELLTPERPQFNLLIDPKCHWALAHMDRFPVEVNRAPYETLLRVPGIGVKGAQTILRARRGGILTFEGLKKIGVSLKRARYFITCGGKAAPGSDLRPEVILRELIGQQGKERMQLQDGGKQMSFFQEEQQQEALKWISVQ